MPGAMPKASSCVGGIVGLVLLLCGATWTSAAALIEKVSSFTVPDQTGRAVAASPGSTHLYVAVLSSAPDRLVVYERDDVVGRLDPIQHFENGTGGLTQMNDPEFVAVSPDGGTVVVTSPSNDALIVFDRDVATGLLTLVEEQKDGVSGVDGLDGAVEAAFSPDSAHLYVAGPEDGKIAVFSRDPVTSALTFVEAEDGGAFSMGGIDTLAISPDGRHIYAGRGSFTRDLVSGELTLLETLSDDYPVRISQDGLSVYYFTPTGIWHYGRDPATGLVTPIDWEGFPYSYSTPRSAWVHPSGEFVYFTWQTYNHQQPWNTYYRLARATRDPVTGAVSAFVEVGGATSKSGPGFFALSDDGSALFAVSDHYDHVYERTIDGNGDLETRAVGFLGPFHISNPYDVVLSPDDAFVYLALSSVYGVGGVTAWARDSTTGELTWVDGESDVLGQLDALKDPRGIALDPAGAHLYVAAHRDDAVTWLNRDGVTGAIEPVGTVEDGVGGVDGIAGATDVIVSPDGRHVYASGEDDNAVAVFERDATTGALTFIEAEFDGQAGVHGLQRPFELAISPDGLHVYVASDGGDAVAVFSRDALSGELTFVDAEVDGMDGVRSLDGPQDIEVSGDGGSVYVLAAASDAVVEFTRDPGTGLLTFRRAHVDELGGVYGIGGHIALSADGLYAYAGSAVFARNPSTGALSFIEVVDGVLQTTSLDSRYVYGFQYEISKWEHTFSGCAGAPLLGCRLAAKTRLAIKDSTDAEKQRLTWTFKNGDPTGLGEFDPAGTKHYGFCLYDESGAVTELVFEALLPANGDCRKNYAGLFKPCWQVTSKVKYSDPYYTPDGIGNVQLLPSLLPRTRIKVKGKGSHLPIDGLPYGLPLRAQLQDVNGGCWEATYGAAQKNDEGRFKAKTP